jgi:protein ImuB
MSHREGLEAALVSLVEAMAERLEASGQGGRAFEARFFRSDGEVKCLTIETGRPSREPASLLRLFRERLENLADPLYPGHGYDALRLSVPVAEALAPLQRDLDGHAAEAGEVLELIERLSVRLGATRVRRFTPRDSHKPERAAIAVPALSEASADAWPVAEEGEPPLRPLFLFAPPQAIDVLAEVPDGPPLKFRWRRVVHEVTLAEGPERIAPEWWRKDGAERPRDYYRIEDAQGRRFWVFRAGLYEEGAQNPSWFLHGLFA